MPLHFDSITKDSQDSRLLAWILTTALDNSSNVLVSADKHYLHGRSEIIDEISGSVIGGYIFTLEVNDEEKAIFVKDVDIVFDSENQAALEFLELRPGSSDANEYYDVQVADNAQRLQIETVNRHSIEGDLVGTTRRVHISAFPFRVDLFDNLQGLNKMLGLDKEITIKGTDYKLGGISEHFTAPGGIMATEGEEDETYSIIVGMVKTLRDVQISLGEIKIPFLLVQLDTALGIIPVAMSREVFEIEGIAPGNVIYMSADIKADLANSVCDDSGNT